MGHLFQANNDIQDQTNLLLTSIESGLRICRTQPESLHDTINHVVISLDHSRKTQSRCFSITVILILYFEKMITGKAACILKISLNTLDFSIPENVPFFVYMTVLYNVRQLLGPISMNLYLGLSCVT